jgi:hypothetical protein
LPFGSHSALGVCLTWLSGPQFQGGGVQLQRILSQLFCSQPKLCKQLHPGEGSDNTVGESPVQFLEGSGGTAKAIANPWPELDFQREPYVTAMKASIPDSIYSLLSLLLHHANCGAAVAIGQCHGPQCLFCVLYWFMVNRGLATAGKWDCNSQFSF